MLVFKLLILIFSVIVHEVAHGYAAYSLGDTTAKRAGRLTLNPLFHIDPIGSIVVPIFLILVNAGVIFGWAKPVPYNPYNLRNQRWGEALVGVAGVATNLLLALFFALVSRAATLEGATLFASLAATITLVNLSLGLFNLLPIPPLDGYTTLRGLLPARARLSLQELETRFFGGNIFTRLVVLFVFVYFFSNAFYLFIDVAYRFLIGG
jgi:Zn-dependent protease